MAATFLSINQLKSCLSFLWDTLGFPALRGAPINLSFFSEDYREAKDTILLSLCFPCATPLETNVKRTNPNHKHAWHHPTHWPVFCVSSPLLQPLGHFYGLCERNSSWKKNLKLHLQYMFGFTMEIYSRNCKNRPTGRRKMHMLGGIKDFFLLLLLLLFFKNKKKVPIFQNENQQVI